MILKYESLLLRSGTLVIQPLLECLRRPKGSISELKLSILQILQKSFLFRHAEATVEIFEQEN